jgi:hypothetical protein
MAGAHEWARHQGVTVQATAQLLLLAEAHMCGCTMLHPTSARYAHQRLQCRGLLVVQRVGLLRWLDAVAVAGPAQQLGLVWREEA